MNPPSGQVGSFLAAGVRASQLRRDSRGLDPTLLGDALWCG